MHPEASPRHHLDFLWRRSRPDHLDSVSDALLPRALQDIGIDSGFLRSATPVSETELAEVSLRAFLRIEGTALPYDTVESLRRLWDSLQTIDSRVTRKHPDHTEETYYRDHEAWSDVFLEHVRRQGIEVKP
jgi:hypothetical protein